MFDNGLGPMFDKGVIARRAFRAGNFRPPGNTVSPPARPAIFWYRTLLLYLRPPERSAVDDHSLAVRRLCSTC